MPNKNDDRRYVGISLLCTLRNCHKLLLFEKQFYISIHSPYACISESMIVHYDSDVFCMLNK